MRRFGRWPPTLNLSAFILTLALSLPLLHGRSVATSLSTHDSSVTSNGPSLTSATEPISTETTASSRSSDQGVVLAAANLGGSLDTSSTTGVTVNVSFAGIDAGVLLAGQAEDKNETSALPTSRATSSFISHRKTSTSVGTSTQASSSRSRNPDRSTTSRKKPSTSASSSSESVSGRSTSTTPTRVTSRSSLSSSTTSTAEETTLRRSSSTISVASSSHFASTTRSSTPTSTRSSTKPVSSVSRVTRSRSTSTTLSTTRRGNPSSTSKTRWQTTSSAHKGSRSASTTSTSRASKTKSEARPASSTSAKPSPTSYGFAPQSDCIEPPSTFGGSTKGFATLCTVRYCDVPARWNMIWSGYDGDVTRSEIESALGMLQNVEPLWENGNGNVLGDGYLGQAAYSASLLFEITGDIRALDVAVRIADNILALQNQNTPNPIVIWTGDVDPVWPTAPLPPNNKSELVYAGCEQGEIVAHMVNAALLILKSPCLWDMVPPVYHGPTVFNETATYYDRALAYVAAGDDTYENYFFRFFDSAGSIIQPADGRWWAVGDSRDPGTLMPWNRRMQMVHGLLKLAAVHETPAVYAPNITNYYDALVQRNVMDFLGALNQTRSRQDGKDIFKWDYSAGEEQTEESKGIHAFYDIYGSWLAWQRSSATYYLSNNFGETMAYTFQNQIYLGNGSFAGLVTGASTKKAYTVDSLWAAWSFYGFFLPEWYETVARSSVEHGFQGRTWLAIPLLWTKHALHVNDLTFWTGLYSSGYGITVETDGTGSAASAIQWGAASRSVPSLNCVVAAVVGIVTSLHLFA